MSASTAHLRGSTTFRGVRVSWAHRIVLEAIEHEGVDFHVNDGRRTKADQLQRIRDHGIWSVSNPHGAAPYTPNAPHVKAGRANHALDVDMFAPRPGGHLRLQAAYARHGVRLVFNVPTEGWHEDPTDELALLRAARRLDDPLRAYPADERRWIREHDAISRKARLSNRDRKRLGVLRRVMRDRRKRIWRSAQLDGWDRINRRARYKSLRART